MRSVPSPPSALFFDCGCGCGGGWDKLGNHEGSGHFAVSIVVAIVGVAGDTKIATGPLPTGHWSIAVEGLTHSRDDRAPFVFRKMPKVLLIQFACVHILAVETSDPVRTSAFSLDKTLGIHGSMLHALPVILHHVFIEQACLLSAFV